MSSSRLRRFFSKATWHRWLQTIRQFEEATDFNELDFLEKRVRSLEVRVAEAHSTIQRSSSREK